MIQKAATATEKNTPQKKPNEVVIPADKKPTLMNISKSHPKIKSGAIKLTTLDEEIKR